LATAKAFFLGAATVTYFSPSALVVLAVFILSGCAGGQGAMFDTLKSVVSRSDSAAGTRLNPDFAYLRLTVEGRVVFLAQGYVDESPAGPTEVWYSAEREVMRFRNGRLVGATGLTTEWRKVTLPRLGSWASIAAAKQIEWKRVRDVMPGYRFGIEDTMATRLAAVPRKTALVGIDPRRLTWFEERIEHSSETVREKEPLPPALYAVDLSGGRESVIYGEQCLAPTLCFTWQRWSAAPGAATQ
jgi:hypothetical protein